MTQMLKIKVESHLINPGNAERSLPMLTSLFSSHITGTKYLHVAKQFFLEDKKCDMIQEHYA